jgi:hypothetical protein
MSLFLTERSSEMKNAVRTVLRSSVVGIAVSAGVWLAAPAWAAPFFFSSGNPDGLLGALSRPSSPGALETETADDFILSDTTTIAQATITGLIPSGTSLDSTSCVGREPSSSATA